MNELNYFRKLMREKRNALTKEFCERASQALIINFKKLKNLDKYNAIGIYSAFDGEIDLKDVINFCRHENKKIFLPKLNNFKNSENKKLIFCEFNSETTLIKNKFGIDESVSDVCVEASALDLLLLPLTAFDKQGHRLGMGQGYYDATLHGLKKMPFLVGVGYAFQEVDALTPHPKDVRLDAILTEKALRLTKS